VSVAVGAAQAEGVEIELNPRTAERPAVQARMVAQRFKRGDQFAFCRRSFSG